MEVTSDQTGELTIDLTGAFGGVSGNYLDTLRADYAFIIAQEPSFKSRLSSVAEVEPPEQAGWNFAMHPNPTRDDLFIRTQSDAPVEIVLLDQLGRQVLVQNGVSGPLHRLSLAGLAKGAYSVVLTDGVHSKAKKLMIH